MRTRKPVMNHGNRSFTKVQISALIGFLAIALAACKNPLATEVKAMQVAVVSPIATFSLSDQSLINSGATIEFGTIAVGSATDISLTLSNSGKTDLVIDFASIAITTADFLIKGQAPAAIPTGQTGTITLSFTPKSNGLKTATIAIPTNDVNHPRVSFTINGTGISIVLTTSLISSIQDASATGGGSVTADGGSAIITRGICWSTSQNPTTANSKIADVGTGLGGFTSFMTGLTAGTVYYVRAFATNNDGTAYGPEVSFPTGPAAQTAPTLAPVGYPAGSGQLSVSWTTTNGPAVYYDLYYSTTSTQPPSANGPSNLTSTASTLSGLTNYANYYVWVVAKNASGSKPSPASIPTMVGIKVASITVSKTSVKLWPGYSETVIATCTPANATLPSVTWGTSNTSYVTVLNGTVTGVGGELASPASAIGTATITASPADGKGGVAGTFTAANTSFVANTAGPAGGYLFYDSGSYDTKGWRYLEAASSNVGANHQWRNGHNIIIPGAQGTDFGTGQTNTSAIIAAMGAGTYMANDCRTYTQNGYSDWFMPSENEANQMLFAVSSIDYAATLYLFVSSSQVNNGSGNGCRGFHCLSPFGWFDMQNSYTGYTVVTRPARRF